MQDEGVWWGVHGEGVHGEVCGRVYMVRVCKVRVCGGCAWWGVQDEVCVVGCVCMVRCVVGCLSW